MQSYIEARVPYLMECFEKLAIERSANKRRDGFKLNQEKIEGWKMLSIKEAALIDKEFADCSQVYINKRFLEGFKKELWRAAKHDLKDPGLYWPVRAIVANFIGRLQEHFTAKTIEINENYRQRVADRAKAENRVVIDITQQLKRAYEVLKVADEGGKASWEDVSCALALVTGRRMGEIHSSAVFHHVPRETHTLRFGGQLKAGKDEEGKELLIPTLVPASLCVAGLDWLATELTKKGNHYRIEDPSKVNATYAKALNEAAKDWNFLPEGTTEVNSKGATVEASFTYHKFRAAYFRAALRLLEPDGMDYEMVASKVLGHVDKSSSNESYKRYNLATDSLFVIQ